MRKIALSMTLILALGPLSFCGKSQADREKCSNECLKTNRLKGQECGADKTCIRGAIDALNACYAKCDAK